MVVFSGLAALTSLEAPFSVLLFGVLGPGSVVTLVLVILSWYRSAAANTEHTALLLLPLCRGE